MTEAAVGEVVVAFRQASNAPMTGVLPVNGTTEYKAENFARGRYDYCDPDDPTQQTLTDGGIFRFPERSTVHVLEIRAFLDGAAPPGTMTVNLRDRDGTHIVGLYAALTPGVNVRLYFHPALPVLPSQELQFITSKLGSIDVYAVKATQHR